jgi:MFS transporter, PPP family, 3-phenylpropionic acid transporter
MNSYPYWRLSSFYFFYFCVVGALIPFWPVYLNSLGYSSADVGIITSIILATRIIAPNFWGYLADKTRKRMSIIRLGSFLAIWFFSLVLYRQDYTWLLMSIICYTFFWHAVLPQFEVITLTYLDKNYHQYGKIRMWGSIGFIVAVLGLGLLFDFIEIKFLPICILVFLILIWISSFGLENKSTTHSSEIGSGFLSLVRHPFMICFLLVCFLLQFSHGPYYTFYTLYLVKTHGYSNSVAGILWSLGVLAEIIVFLLAPRLFRHFSLPAMMLWSLFLSAIRWLLIGFLATNLPLLILAQAFHAFSFGIAHAIAIDWVRQHFQGHQSQGQALYSSLSFGAGGAVGALVGGLVWDFNTQYAFLVAAVAAILAWLIGLWGFRWYPHYKISSH